MRTSIALTLCWLQLGIGALGADWPTYRANPTRDGCSTEELPAKLVPLWTHKASAPPRPAWPKEGRMVFDRAFQVVVAGGTLYFGSSADCGVHALDAATGRKRWSFFTAAPVRFAPALSGGRVLVGSDDGFLYCLSARGGELLWKKRGGPNAGMIMGNGRMISRWPVRGGPVVADGKVHFAAGIWPADGVYLHALDAASGKVIWTNDSLGRMTRGHPHQLHVKIPSGIGVQGHLAVSGETLLVPTGRNVPAAVDLATGKLKHFVPFGYGGGSEIAVVDALLFCGRNAYSLANGKDAFGRVRSRNQLLTTRAPVTVTGKLIFRQNNRGKGLDVIDRATPFSSTGQGRNYKARAAVKQTLRVECQGELIAAGQRVFAAGGGTVTAIDAGKLEAAWKAEVPGNIWGLAAAGGRLYVSTDVGGIHCFGSGRGSGAVAPRKEKGSRGDSGSWGAAAEEILKKVGVREGYCVDLGCGAGELVCELAKRSKLMIVGIEKDASMVLDARRRLASAGLYGRRVVIYRGDPAKSFCPADFANLVVSARSVQEGQAAVASAEAARLQRPWGGVICIGKAGAMKKSVRGPMAGAGQWTHLYADAGNTLNSGDKIARGPLRTFWFGGPDLDTPNRHGRPPGPLFYEGRQFTLGRNALRAIDAYNGRLIWECAAEGIGAHYKAMTLMGVAIAGGDMCVAPEGLFVRRGEKCLRIDPATGKQLAEFQAPKTSGGKRGRWSYLACDGGLLFGSVADEEHQVRKIRTLAKMLRNESLMLFAMDAKTGKAKWTFEAKESLRNNAIAVGGGKVFLIDRPIAAADKLGSKERKGKHPTGELIALDAATGRELWRNKEDIFGTTLALSTEHGVVVMGYQVHREGLLPSEVGGRLAAFDAANGKRLWALATRLRPWRPIIVGKEVHSPPLILDLRTGKQAKWDFQRNYGCGIITASKHLMLFRSGPLGYVNFGGDRKTMHHGGVRPGCWVNAVAAGGMVLMPNSYNDCECSYLIRTNVALRGANDFLRTVKGTGSEGGRER